MCQSLDMKYATPALWFWGKKILLTEFRVNQINQTLTHHFGFEKMIFKKIRQEE